MLEILPGNSFLCVFSLLNLSIFYNILEHVGNSVRKLVSFCVSEIVLGDSTFGCEDWLRIGVCSQRHCQEHDVTVDDRTIAAQHDSP